MKQLQPTTQFKKDLKRYRHQPKLLSELKEMLDLLINELPIPDKYMAHSLVGKYKGCFECHIESDFLLIWIDEKRDVIELVRLGSHSELFGKK